MMIFCGEQCTKHNDLQETEERRGLEHQVETLAGQLSGERSRVRSLEETLNQKRRTEWSSEASIKQLEVEKNQLQRKVRLFQQCYIFMLPHFNISRYKRTYFI